MELPYLKGALDVASAGLNTKDFIPSFRDFFFEQGYVSTFNGKFGVHLFCDVPLTGSVRGDVLTAFLNKVTGATVQIQEQDTMVQITVGRSHLDIPYVSASVSPLEALVETIEYSTPLSMSQAILPGLEQCLKGAADDPTMGSKMGIIFAITEEAIDVYATDSKTVSWFHVAGTTGVTTPMYFSVSILFVDQLSKLVKKLMTEELLFFLSEHALVILLDHTCTVVGAIRQLSQKDIDIFGRIIDTHTHYSARGHDVPILIPAALAPALARAQAVVYEKDGNLTTCTFDGMMLTLETKTVYGHVKDCVVFDQPVPTMSFLVDVALLQRVLVDGMTIELTETKCLILRHGLFTYFIGTQAAKGSQ